MAQTLRAITDKPAYSTPVAKNITFELYVSIYKPLFDIMGITLKRQNAPFGLREALDAGTVWYEDGAFRGKFSAVVSKELRRIGATFDSKTKTYKIKQENIPVFHKTLILSGNEKDRNRKDDVLEALEKVISGESQKIDFSNYSTAIVSDLHTQFLVGIPTGLNVPMELTSWTAKKIMEEYIENLNTYSNKLKVDEMEKLREKVLEAVSQGYRSDKVADLIRTQYGQTKKHADFIARQETSLLVSKYREARYGEAGIERYMWYTANDERVRPDHAALDNHIFSWDSPPIVNRATGKRGNPGEDFNCRCIARAVLD